MQQPQKRLQDAALRGGEPAAAVTTATAQMQAQRAVRRCKCVVLGAPGVGKSALVQAFHSDGTQFPKTYTMTVHAEVCVKTVNIPDSPASVELFLFDVAGHDAFAEYVPKYCDGAAVFMLVFDVANADSFAALAKLLPVARHARVGKSNAGILVANKVDLTTRRVVTTAQAEEFAKANRLAYFECSAMANSEVDAPFYYACNWFHEHFEEAVRGFVKAGESG